MHGNKGLQSDYTRIKNDADFCFILVVSGQPVAQFQPRVDIQNKLISDLLALGSSYNRGFCETTKPRPVGQFPSEPGVFSITCKTTNTVYYGHTAQQGGIGGRLHSMRAQFNKNQLPIQKLQQDWTNKGREQGFEIQPYVWGVDYETEASQKELVNQLLWQAQSNGRQIYNTPLASQPAVATNPIPPPMEWVGSVPYFPSQTQFPSSNPISLGEQIAVVVNGHIYLSLTEAARCLGTTDKTVRARAKSPDYPDYSFAYREDVQAELVRRNWSDNTSMAILQNIQKSSKGTVRAVVIY